MYSFYPDAPKGIATDFPRYRVHLRLDDMVAIFGVALAGLGVARMPMFLGRAAAGLVQVPLLPPQHYADIWMVGHPDVWPSRELSAFWDILIPYCKSHRGSFVA